MELNIVALTNAYDALGSLVATVHDLWVEINDLGNRPQLEAVIYNDEDYNPIVANQIIWDAALLALRVELAAAVQDQIIAEDAVLAVLPPNQWVGITGLIHWGGLGRSGATIGQPGVSDGAIQPLYKILRGWQGNPADRPTFDADFPIPYSE